MAVMSLEPTTHALAELGPFFAIAHVEPEARWRPVRSLLQADILGERIDFVGGRIGSIAGVTVERRVAASTMSLGLFARLVAPVLGAQTLGIDIPRPTLDTAWWQPTEGGPWPFGLTGEAEAADISALLADPVTRLVDGVADVGALSRRILWGNVASAVFGAARMIGQARPDLAQTALDTAGGLLDGPLKGTGELRDAFVRSTCCLYYRVPGGGYCGDCVLEKR